MAKSQKEKKAAAPKEVNPAEDLKSKKTTSKSKKADEEEEDDDDLAEVDDKPAVKAGKVGAKSKSKSGEDDDDDEDGEEVADEWEKPEEEDNWDPDFDEFDIPKSTGKKTPKKGGATAEDEDDFAIDDEFKDMGLFDDSGGFDDDDDDF